MIDEAYLTKENNGSLDITKSIDNSIGNPKVEFTHLKS